MGKQVDNLNGKRGSDEAVGGQLLSQIAETSPRDSFTPNDLPPIDETRHSKQVIQQLQKRAMQLD
jgi:hypothetical protein